MADKNILGLMVKFPRPGLVKTRLAGDIGDNAACRVCRTMAEKTIVDTLPAAGSYDRIIFYAPSESEPEVRRWLPGERIISQRGEDIGKVMDNAFCDIFEAGAGKGVLIGADIPGLNSDMVDLAFQLLGGADVVIGPATDGGYYLIGLKLRTPEIFRGMAWGTASVLRETLRTARNLRLRVTTMTAMSDVDTIDDLLRMKVLHPGYFEDR